MKRLRGTYDSVGIIYPTDADRKSLQVVNQLIQSICLETFNFKAFLAFYVVWATSEEFYLYSGNMNFTTQNEK